MSIGVVKDVGLLAVKGNNFFELHIKQMSGIAGIVGDVVDLEHCLVAMQRCQKHRGDGEDGYWISSFVDGQLGLSCCSRTVSEVEEFVRQPYVDEDTRLVVMADCDISNYRELRVQLQAKYQFSTESSIEVISKAYCMWGEAFLHRLKGSFVIVIYDKSNDVLLIARDRFGEKPLYYTTRRGVLYFASEIRPIFSSGVISAVSAERWAGYLLYSTYGPDYATFWEGIYQLPAGTLMRCNGYSLIENRWYDLHDEIMNSVESCDVKTVSEIFFQSLEERAERSLSDVSSCGLRVTARVESRLLHSIINRGQHHWKVHAFTSEIESVGRQPIATPVWLTESEIVSELEKMPHWIEEPFDGRETFARIAILRRVHRDGISVLSSGLGLDVLWQELWDVGGLQYNYNRKHDIFSDYLTSMVAAPRHSHYFGGEMDENRYCELCRERMPHILRFMSRLSAEVDVSMRMPFLDSDLVVLAFVMPVVLRRNRSSIFRDCVASHHSCHVSGECGASTLPMWMQGTVKEWINDSISDLCRGVLRLWFDVASMEHFRSKFNDGCQCDEQLLWKCVSLYQMLNACRRF